MHRHEKARPYEEKSHPFGEFSYREVLVGNNSSPCVKFNADSNLVSRWKHFLLVGEVLDMKVLCDLKNRLHGIVDYGPDIKYLWGMKVLLTFGSTVGARKFLNERREEHEWIFRNLQIWESQRMNIEWKGRTLPVWIQETSRCWAPDFISNPAPYTPSTSGEGSSLTTAIPPPDKTVVEKPSSGGKTGGASASYSHDSSKSVKKLRSPDMGDQGSGSSTSGNHEEGGGVSVSFISPEVGLGGNSGQNMAPENHIQTNMGSDMVGIVHREDLGPMDEEANSNIHRPKVDLNELPKVSALTSQEVRARDSIENNWRWKFKTL
ncbi:hypothetical protein L1987_20261 [Smallanthus sonchifolius]|uniref:Uncharacterized protein n=1 Tax=Smallanthus sonchifolius TaxID=185202 RepID=A0ACB9IT13_9ASTR|nr:hypothetical protein L1987_20261 [Smallanthus sonchifolius]